jgi:predicted enzyme related to lactoylglutathione lyase
MATTPSRATLSISLLLIGTIACGAFPELPAFQDPPTDVRYPGKLIWADLFTEDIEASTEFYTALFGWTAETIGSGKESYTVFRLNGRPIAGMIYRPAFDKASSKGTWLPYFSVEDLSETLSVATANGGRIDVALHNFPNRGEQVIIRDNQLALVGLMQSTHGDPDDYLAEYGEWIWAQLWVDDPEASIAFYEATLGFAEVEGNPDDSNIYTHAFATDGIYRASLDEIPESKPNARPGWLIFVRVEDLNETLARVPDLGGSIYLEPDPEIRDGELAIIEDPAGAGIILIEYEPSAEDEQ